MISMALCRITRAHAHTLAFACTPRVLHSSSPSPTRSTTSYITERACSLSCWCACWWHWLWLGCCMRPNEDAFRMACDGQGCWLPVATTGREGSHSRHDPAATSKRIRSAPAPASVQVIRERRHERFDADRVPGGCDKRHARQTILRVDVDGNVARRLLAGYNPGGSRMSRIHVQALVGHPVHIHRLR